MIEKIFTRKAQDTLGRSMVKSLSYRFLIISLDFIFFYLFTGQLKTAVGFTIISNSYTTVAYFIHERIWTKIKWGREKNRKPKSQKKY